MHGRIFIDPTLHFLSACQIWFAQTFCIRGHLKLTSTVLGMPVMERASRMRLMHRLLHWGVPEETRLTQDVAQCTGESTID